MSRTSKAVIIIPENVQIKIENKNLCVSGKNGKLFVYIHEYISTKQINKKLIILPKKLEKRTISLIGTTKTLIKNMIFGVTYGFNKTLQLVGVGYRATIEDKKINLSLGFSHVIQYRIPNGIFVECPNQTEILISGSNKQLVGQVAADLRSYKKPEPYKGKGIRYIEEKIKIKETKKK